MMKFKDENTLQVTCNFMFQPQMAMKRPKFHNSPVNTYKCFILNFDTV